MSIMLFFLLAIGLAAVTWSLCFVGCILPTSGLPGGPSTPPYSDVVLKNANIIAYWPLNDAQGSGTPITTGSLTNSSSFGTAHDLAGNHDGTYIAPPSYPSTPIAMSATIPDPPTVGPSGTSIVPGDTGGSGAKVPTPGSVALNGGYVSIPWSTQSPPSLAQFTFEVWIEPQNWVTGQGISHVLFGALAINGAGNVSGFVIATDNTTDPTRHLLQIVWGNGTPVTHSATSMKVAIDPTSTMYVGVSGEAGPNGGFNLFAIEGDSSAQTDVVQNAGYVAIDTTDPTLQVTFFIGAGRNDQTPRTMKFDPNGAPEFPFQGQMQSAALYSTVFQTGDFQSNFLAGSGG